MKQVKKQWNAVCILPTILVSFYNAKVCVLFFSQRTVPSAAWPKSALVLKKCSFVFTSLATFHNSFPFKFCPWKEKRKEHCLYLQNDCVKFYMCVHMHIYGSSNYHGSFISAFSDLFSRKHNQVVKKKTYQQPFKEQRTVLFSFLLPLNFYSDFIFCLGLKIYFWTRSLETFFRWMENYCDVNGLLKQYN